jgi:transposase
VWVWRGHQGGGRPGLLRAESDLGGVVAARLRPTRAAAHGAGRQRFVRHALLDRLDREDRRPVGREPARLRGRCEERAAGPGLLPADQTPVNTAADTPEADGQCTEDATRTFNPYVFTLRSARIVWPGAGHTRRHAALDLFDLFGRYTGTLVTDDYAGYLKYEANLAARQLCNAHLIRSARGIAQAEPGAQAWATAMIEVLRSGRAAVKAASAPDRTRLEDIAIKAIRAAYLQAAEAGIAANAHRRTSTGGRHPGYVLATRMRDKIDQVLHHPTDFAAPWTCNLAEQALRHTKIHLKISGCFRTLKTTRAYCRIHSYPITARLHAIPPMQAIRDALAGNAWTPLRAPTPP